MVWSARGVGCAYALYYEADDDDKESSMLYDVMQ